MPNAGTAAPEKKDRGNIFWRTSKKFQFAADKLIPDAFVFCIILAMLTFVLGWLITDSSFLDMVTYWYDGFWTQNAFAFQMTIMVVVCASFAKAKQVRKGLDKLAGIAHTPRGAMCVLMIFGYVSSFINWAFCTICTPILAMRIAKKVKGCHFPMMIAAGYTTMILGQCMGPSATVYSLVATEGHFMEDEIGILHQNETTYNTMNVILWFILAIVVMIVSVLTTPPASEIVEFHGTISDEDIEVEESKDTPAERMNSSKIIMYVIAAIGIIYIIWSFVTKGFLTSLNMNFIIFLFVSLDALVYNTPRKFIAAIRDSMYLATDVMIQFPFYGAIMGMMTSSGLGEMIINGMSKLCTTTTMPMWTYISACILNLFIPSQGGQFIVQGPILIPVAKSLGCYIPDILNAFVYGDEATNLLQPLYLIPALAVVNTPLKKVWGYCAYIFIIMFVITCIGLLILPGLV
ncbi:MAG: short-chain fatty acid transporter [Eubacterium sp.]|jgi:short-chain fatty acids transporter